uniref:Hemimethylated DNA-binding domain-containing protein n=1 Tax=Mola mola TaxID=94237 RepID=A0A3Q3VTZ5_MOLML
MPQLTATAVLQLALLLSAVPAQYFISRWAGTTATQRYHATTRMLRIWKDWRKSYLNGTAWTEWANQLVAKEDPTAQQSLDMERMLYENNEDFFGGLSTSKTVRSPHPPYVFLRVGEVVMEMKGHMVGVVVSWDPEMRAPPEWAGRLYASSEVENTPHYKVLFNGPGPSSVIVGYLPQTQLKRITGIRPDIPTLERYFTHYNGERFVMQPWLRKLFPDDAVEDNEIPTW